MSKQTSNTSKHTALHPAEEATIRAFVVAAKRERLLALLANTKRRAEACETLNHFADWDARYTVPVDASADVLALLRKFGAPPVCHVVSDSPELDGRDMPLSEAVRACEDWSFASVLCCVPGGLAFYFDEVAAPRERLLLRRAGD